MEKINADKALEKLLAGNKRFMSKNFYHPNQTKERQKEVIREQSPFAAILGCSDSRVPPEIIFDQGIGDLFVIRIAGNILSDAIKGSMEYAAGYLHVKLIIVLGHSNCGAVSAAITRGELYFNITSIVNYILPSVQKAKDMNGNFHENTIKLNILKSVEQLKKTPPILNKLSEQGEIKITGAYYDLESGSVEIIHT